MTVEERAERAFMEILADLCDRRDIKHPLQPFRNILVAVSEGEVPEEDPLLDAAYDILDRNVAVIAKHIRNDLRAVRAERGRKSLTSR